MDWQEKLQLNVTQMITSKGLRDYGMVVDLFEKQFDKLTKEIRRRDASMATVDRIGDSTFFYIHNFDLGLKDDRKEIQITKGDKDKSTVMGKITFEEGFCYVESNQGSRIHLNETIVDRLFKEAFKNLHE